MPPRCIQNDFVSIKGLEFFQDIVERLRLIFRDGLEKYLNATVFQVVKNADVFFIQRNILKNRLAVWPAAETANLNAGNVKAQLYGVLHRRQ